jgi:hypothetical protein
MSDGLACCASIALGVSHAVLFRSAGDVEHCRLHRRPLLHGGLAPKPPAGGPGLSQSGPDQPGGVAGDAGLGGGGAALVAALGGVCGLAGGQCAGAAGRAAAGMAGYGDGPGIGRAGCGELDIVAVFLNRHRRGVLAWLPAGWSRFLSP